MGSVDPSLGRQGASKRSAFREGERIRRCSRAAGSKRPAHKHRKYIKLRVQDPQSPTIRPSDHTLYPNRDDRHQRTVQPSPPTECRSSQRLSRDMVCLLPFPAPQFPSTPDNPGAAGPGQIAEPNVDNTIQGCPCLICSRTGYDYQTNQRTTEYQDQWVPVVRTIYYSITALSSYNWDSSPRGRLSRMRTRTLVVAIHTAPLPLWMASHRHGLSLPKPRWVARSSVVGFV